MANTISNKTRIDLIKRYLLYNIYLTLIKHNCFLTPSLKQIPFIMQTKLDARMPYDATVYSWILHIFCNSGDFSIFTANFKFIFKHYIQLLSLYITMVTGNTDELDHLDN